ncbi:amidohydrolase family protein [Microlunatus spumicola]|uniref:Amidohydrolase family protein n=1 Tax=Microlunatus spumicola TaxID=81499 RepID=A0ABP6X3J6_9ACTN
MTPPGGVHGLAEHLEQLALVDHHVHGVWTEDADAARLANAFNEADTAPLADPSSAWDTQLGFAVRRWCAPLLDLEPHPAPETYLRRRAELGETEVARRLLDGTNVSDWLVDTGWSRDLSSPAGLAALGGGTGREIVRLETLAEELLPTLDDPADWADAFAARVEDAARRCVGFKSVIAYRCGFAVDLAPPAPEAVAEAARRWQAGLEDGAAPRLDDPTLVVSGLYAALRTRRPLQLHVGFGDRDLDLASVDPLLLTDLLRRPEVRGVPVMLLHCYPYERHAGYLAQAFPEVHLDVGLATHFLGARAPGVVARSLELAPFRQVLYSSDAAGPAELHHLGARLWRNAMAQVLGGWVEAGDWSVDDARRVATLVGRDNARRAYDLD